MVISGPRGAKRFFNSSYYNSSGVHHEVPTELPLGSPSSSTQALVVSPKATTETAPATVRLGRSRSPLDPLLLEVEAFGEVHKLSLTSAPSPLSVDFKLQTAAVDEDGVFTVVDIKEEDEESVSDLYHDTDTGSVVLVDGDKVEGFITPTLSLHIEADGTHTAIRQYSPIPEQMTHDYVQVPEGVLKGQVSSKNTNREIVSVNPEIYVVVDSALASKFKSNTRVRQYLSVFWNAVNQRFATFADPSINLVLAGALILRRSQYETFINDNILMGDYIHGENTLGSFSDWLFTKNTKFPNYDLAYLMTGKDMADVENSVIQGGLAGIAWRGAACVVSTYNKRNFKAAMGEDQEANYVGVMTAAHEVAHNLGSPHDGSDGAEACSWDDGYIMSYVSGSPNKVFFSSCSQQLMKDYMLTTDGECLSSLAVGSNIALSSQLPGDLITMDQQCQKTTGKSDAYASKSADEDSLCVQLECQWQVKEGNRIWTYTQSSGRPAAEGSACRSGGKCINGSCQ
ncbi:A disintegrin and metalloproteinase with thrombospondin motifs like [Macrobrachium nipponense]|uniref:A disintegrin and metalloproteinase with thrombospondin motifs like n=1 Tax=Macrobrachium nipponense TaxID=159736 RepID=UPI0030C80E9F